MTTRRAAACALACAGLTLGMVRPVLEMLILRKLRRRAPESFDGARAAASILEALAQDGYTLP